MFEKAFEVAVAFSAIDHLTGPMMRMGQQLGIIKQQAEEAQRQLDRFKATAAVGGAITLAGAGLAKGIMSAVESAGRLQTSMMGVKESLGLTNAEYQKMMDMSQTIGIPTIFSSEQVGDIMQAMSTAGLSKQQVMDPSILKDYVNFADVQAQIKHENAPDVVSSGINMAHQYQLYSTQEIEPFLNQLNAALLHTHDTADEFATTYKYISNQARSMGMSASDTLSTTAWLGRMGFGSGRGGTNFADFLQRSIYHSSGKKADEAMVQAGFVQNGHSVFEDAKGNFVGIPKAVEIMQDFAKRFGNDANKMNPLLHDIFDTQGARVAMMMTSSGASEQFANVQKQIGSTASIDQTQEDLNNTWQGKTKQLQTTLQDIAQAFGQSVMPYLLPVIKFFDDLLGKVLEFEKAHPKITAFIAAFAGIAAAASLIVGPLMIFIGALGYLRTSGMVAVGLRLISSSFLTILGPVGLTITAVSLLYEAWTHNFLGIQDKTKSVIDWIKTEFGKLKSYMDPVLQFLGFENKTSGKVQGPQLPIQGPGVKNRTPGLGSIPKFKMPNWLKTGWNQYVSLSLKPWIMLGTALKPIVNSIWNTIKTAFTQVSDFFKRIWPDIVQLAQWTWPLIKATIFTTLGVIWPIVRTVLGAIWATIKLVFNDIATVTQVTWTIVKDVIGVAWNIVAGIITVGLDLLTGHWHAAWEDFKNYLGGAWNYIKKTISDAITGIGTLIEGFANSAWQWGSDVMSGLANGLKSGIGFLKTAWNDAISILPEAIRSKLEIHSPSRVMAQMGEFVAQGLALGMTDNRAIVKTAATGLANIVSGQTFTPNIGSAQIAGSKLNPSGSLVNNTNNAYQYDNGITNSYQIANHALNNNYFDHSNSNQVSVNNQQSYPVSSIQQWFGGIAESLGAIAKSLTSQRNNNKQQFRTYNNNPITQTSLINQQLITQASDTVHNLTTMNHALNYAGNIASSYLYNNEGDTYQGDNSYQSYPETNYLTHLNATHHYDNSVRIDPGAIQINIQQQPGEDADKLIDRVKRTVFPELKRYLGRELRNGGNRSGVKPRNAW